MGAEGAALFPVVKGVADWQEQSGAGFALWEDARRERIAVGFD
jgi:hypothetical protein